MVTLNRDRSPVIGRGVWMWGLRMDSCALRAVSLAVVASKNGKSLQREDMGAPGAADRLVSEASGCGRGRLCGWSSNVMFNGSFSGFPPLTRRGGFCPLRSMSLLVSRGHPRARCRWW